MSGFEQAFHAKAITGTTSVQDINNSFLADSDGFYAGSQKRIPCEKHWVKPVICGRSGQSSVIYTTTLLRESRMFGEVEIPGNTISHWFALDKADYMTNLPRQTLEKIASLAPVENYKALLRFLSKYRALGPILAEAVEETLKLDKHVSTEITVFGEPDDSDYSVYINTLLAVDSYDKAYELEETVFNKVIDPHFDLVDFKIILAFDTDSDD